MANILFGDQNFADADYYTPLHSGGSWLTALPLTNLQNDVFSKVARSSNDAEASTRVHTDLQVARDVRVLAACNHNLSRSGAIRMRGSRSIAWSGVTLAANASAGASSLSVQCSGGSAMLRTGDSFTLLGDTTNYTLTSSLAIGGNRVPNSEDSSAALFTPDNASVTTNAETAPDGTATADFLEEDTSTDFHSVQLDLTSLSIPNDESVECSVFVKPEGARNIGLLLETATGGSAYVRYDLINEEVYDAPSSGDGVVTSSGVEALPDGWYRVWMVCKNTGATGHLYALYAYLDTAAFAGSYLGVAGSGAYLWGWQVASATSLTVYKQSGATAAYQVFTGSVSITPTLAGNQLAGDVLTCVSGEYVSSEPAADSGWQDVWPVVYPWYLAWEHPSFWDGRVTEEERRNYPKDFIYDIGETATARYWLTEFSDTTNDDGYVEFGRLFISRGYQPSHNFNYDNEFGWQDDTLEVAALGAEYFDVRVPVRVFNCVIENIEEDEALVYLFEMQRRVGKKGQLVVVLDPDATTHWQRKSFIARNIEITPLSNPHYNRHSAAMRLREIRRA